MAEPKAMEFVTDEEAESTVDGTLSLLSSLELIEKLISSAIASPPWTHSWSSELGGLESPEKIYLSNYDYIIHIKKYL